MNSLDTISGALAMPGLLGGMLAAIGLAALVVAALLAAGAWRSAARRAARLEQGIAELEQRHGQRADAIQEDLRSLRSALEEAQRELRLRPKGGLLEAYPARPEINIAAESVPAVQRAPFAEDADRGISGDNVVPLHGTTAGRRGAADASAGSDQQSRVNGAKVAEAIAAGAITAWYQPIIGLPDRIVRYLEATPYLAIDDDEAQPADRWYGCAVKRGLAGEVARQMLVECLALARRLRREKRDGSVIWKLDRAALAETHDRERIDALLTANASLRRKLLIGVSVDEYRLAGQEFLDFLHHLREIGFSLVLTEGEDVEQVAKIVATGLFHLVAMSSRTILTRDVGRGSSPAARLRSAASRSKIELAATGIENEENAIELIDRDVLLAQGPLFSGPKPLRKDKDAHGGARNNGSDAVPGI